MYNLTLGLTRDLLGADVNIQPINTFKLFHQDSYVNTIYNY